MMKIAYIDGERLRRALIAGSERLMEHAAGLNAINVFPVADGDTGTNMASTARTIALELRGIARQPLGEALRVVADSALSGARGNSGAILAQFFQGLAEDLGQELRITTKRFAKAIQVASDRTKAALSRPREGTILTVLRDWSEAAFKAAERSDDFLEVLGKAQDEAAASLARTREIMPELRKAGVVDAGAQGFFHLLEGIMAFIGTGRLRDIARRQGLAAQARQEFLGDFDLRERAGEELATYRYCTETFVAGECLDLAALRASLESLGDSLVLAGSTRRAKIHIHSDRPSVVFRIAGGFGELSGQKVDDMELQCRIAARGETAAALLVDSAGDLSDGLRLELGVERVPVQVELGGKRHLDRDGLRSDEFIGMLRASPELELSTSQPSPADFARKFDLLFSSAREVVYLGIAGSLSGTLEAGRLAAIERSAQAGRPGAFRIVDSRSISIGTAVVARRAAEAAASGATADEVARLAEEDAARGHLLFTVPDLRGLIKSGRIGGVKGLVLRALGIRPLITLDPLGRPVAGGAYLGKRAGVAAILSKLRKIASPGSFIDAIVGHVDAPAEAEALCRAIRLEWRLARPLEIAAVCPALAVHTGLGAVAVAFLTPLVPASRPLPATAED
jgi:DegV family protein with EDD domain